MSGEDQPEGQGDGRAAVGRPKLGRARRIRITTTIEPSKLARLRAHARQVNKSLGQLADEYVREHFASSPEQPP